MTNKKVFLIPVTKNNIIEYFGKRYYYGNFFEKNNNYILNYPNTYIVIYGDNVYSNFIGKVSPDMFMRWKRRNYQIVYFRGVLTEKYQYL